MPPDAALIDRLAALPLFQSVPRPELAWLVAQGELRTVAAGTVLGDSDTPTDEMFVLVEGRVGLYIEKGGGSRKLLEAVAGQVLGTIPYSRFQRAPGVAIIEEHITALVLHQRHFPILTREYPGLTTALVHHMLDRARDYRSVQLNDDRLQSLSRLASGFAHELNNPASAAARTAQSLVGLLDEEERAARELAAARLGDDQLAAVDAVRQECGRTAQTRTALEAADREDDIAEWLTRHGIEPAAAEALALSDVTMAALARLADALPPEAMRIATRWIASGCAARVASRQIAVATGRIHDMVHAVKGFTFMDRERMPAEVDVAQGLADTIAVLESKSSAKSVDLRLDTADRLPAVWGYGSEINQVWQTLIDNAIDAVDVAGSVTITASVRGDSIVVRVADNGSGIPGENLSRVFDPFFTTKSVGRGSGLGLHQARHTVHLHNGDIELSSKPGRTVFRVRLPASGVAAAQPGSRETRT
jgi:signal transduction histidine kinase